MHELPRCAVAQGLEVSRGKVLQHKVVQAQVSNQTLQTATGVAKFCSDLLARFESDFRLQPRASYPLGEQLRQGVEPVAMLDAIFGLSYLMPKYQLKWAGKNIDELSPGERGTLLLIFTS